MRPSSPRCGEGGELLQSGKIDLVFHRAVLAPARVGISEQSASLRGGGRDRLLGIDVLAGGERLGEDADPLLGRRRVEEDRPGRVGERGVEIGGPFRDAVGARDRGKAVAVAADQQQAGHQSVIAEREAAFVDDRNQGIGQMLRRADAAGRAVDDDPDRLRCHRAVRQGRGRRGEAAARLCYAGCTRVHVPGDKGAPPHRLPDLRLRYPIGLHRPRHDDPDAALARRVRPRRRAAHPGPC